MHLEALEGRTCARCSYPGMSLPVRPQRVVALALLRVREDLVRLRDLLELLRRPLGHVRVVLAREPAVGGLDGLLVGRAVDPENLVVVLEFHDT
jgi:hypothetical protein